MIEWIGFTAGAITTLCYVPQAWHILYTRQTAGISLITYIMLVTGALLWTIYGISIVNWPIILANAITLVLVSAILVMKIRLR